MGVDGFFRRGLSCLLLLTLTVALVGQSFNWRTYQGREVRVLLPEHPVTDGVRSLLKDFQQQTGINVKLDTLAEDLYFDRMEVSLRGRGKRSNMDVYLLPMDSTAYTQYSNGLIHSLQPYLDDPKMTSSDYDVQDFPAGILGATRYQKNGQWEYHGIPASTEVYILMYNKDLVNKYLGGQLPETMDQLVAAAKKVKEESKGQVAGAALRGIRSDTLIDTVTGLVYDSWGGGGSDAPYNVWFDGSWNKPRFTNPRVIKGLANYAGLMEAGPVNIQAMDWPEASQMFKLQRAAFFVDASLFALGFEEKGSPIAGKVGYQPLPPDNDEGKSYSGQWTWGFGIPANASQPEAAWFFIQWITHKNQAAKMGKFHGGAPRVSTWDDPGYRSSLPPEYANIIPKVLASSRASVVYRPGWARYALRIVDVIQDIYSGVEPAAAGQKAQRDFISMVDDDGPTS